MQKKRKLLILEDDVIAQLTLKGYLEGLGYKDIKIVDSGIDAIKTVMDTNYHLCFLNIKAKGKLNGIETGKIINKISNVPIAYATASSENEIFDQTVDVRHIGYLSKPLEKTALEKVLAKVENTKEELPSQSEIEMDFLQKLLASTKHISICILDEAQKIVETNAAFCRLTGYPLYELKEKKLIDLLLPDYQENLDYIFRQIHNGAFQEEALELEIKMKSDRTRFVNFAANSFQMSNKKRFYLLIFNDLSEVQKNTENLEENQKKNELIIRELYHRMKNSLNMVSGLLFLQSSKVAHMPDIYKMFMGSINRVKTLSVVYEKLYQRRELGLIDFKDYLQSLVKNLLSSFREEEQRINLHMDLEGLALNIEKASCCGLIVNEILTNSFKYAYPEGRKGNIYIYLKNDNGYCCLILQDDGIGFSEMESKDNNKSLGTQLIYNLSYQINANIEKKSEKGTKYTLRFKID